MIVLWNDQDGKERAMKTTCSFTNPDAMEVTVSVTMSLRQWRELTAQMRQVTETQYPLSELRFEINDVIRKVEKSFLADSKATAGLPTDAP